MLKGSSLHAFFFAFTLSGVLADFFVILLKGSEIFSGFREFSLFHALSDVPMHECSLGVHKIEFVIDSGEDLSDGGRVGDHADGSHNLGEITTWDDGGWLVVNTDLEASWAPIDELDSSLGLDGSNSGVDVFRDDITSVHHAAGHVSSVSGIAFGHHGSWLEG